MNLLGAKVNRFEQRKKNTKILKNQLNLKIEEIRFSRISSF